MLTRFTGAVACLVFLSIGARAQEANSALSVPFTLSGNVRATNGPAADNDASPAAAGFRTVLSPTLQLSQHWFVYSALEAHSSNYFAYPAGSSYSQPVEFQVMQAFVGYSTTVSKASLLIKAGQLSSAFGSFPVEYDDAKTPFIDAPPVYTSSLPLRPDQLPCGTVDVLSQTYGWEVAYQCGGSARDRYGMTPVTLYGLPGVESELSFSRLDARLQLTNSSPANPQALTSGSQRLQWTAGGGYSLPGGLHVGASGFRGPYLDKILTPALPPGTQLKNYLASGEGIDAEWSRGPWSIAGEWQHFRFELPGFLVSPSENAAYCQVKRILSPRTFFGLRATAEHFGPIQDSRGATANQFAGPQQIYEFTFGYRINRQQLLKIGSNWTDRNSWSVGDWSWPQAAGYTFEAQLVTSITAVSKIFR